MLASPRGSTPHRGGRHCEHENLSRRVSAGGADAEEAREVKRGQPLRITPHRVSSRAGNSKAPSAHARRNAPPAGEQSQADERR